MPETPKSSKKLPVWAYALAAGIGVLLVYFLYRGKGSSQTATLAPTGSSSGTQPTFFAGGGSAGCIADGDCPSGFVCQNGLCVQSSGGGGGGGTVPNGMPCPGHAGTPGGPCKTGKADGVDCPGCASGWCVHVHNGVDVCGDKPTSGTAGLNPASAQGNVLVAA